VRPVTDDFLKIFSIKAIKLLAAGQQGFGSDKAIITCSEARQKLSFLHLNKRESRLFLRYLVAGGLLQQLPQRKGFIISANGRAFLSAQEIVVGGEHV
jgi:hypothetical protein